MSFVLEFPVLIRRCFPCLVIMVTTNLTPFADVTVQADLVYNFTDQGASAQNGYSLAGQLVVSDTAADDGVLTVSELLSWNYTVNNGSIIFSNNSSDPSRGDSLSGVHIDQFAITTTDQFLIGNQFGQFVYRDGDNTFSSVAFQPSYQVHWLNQAFSASPMPIATPANPTPEPAQAALLVIAVLICGLFRSLRRMKGGNDSARP